MPPEPSDLLALERAVGTRFDLVSFFQAWGSRYGAFDPAWFRSIQALARTPLLAWEPWQLPSDLVSSTTSPAPPGPAACTRATDQPAYSLRAIARGDHDPYVRGFARALGSLGYEVWIRPMHEMNGNWYPWCGTTNGNSPAEFVAAWRRLVSTVREEGIANVRWVWSPYARSYPTTAENAIERYFPGEEWVDYVGINGFNWSSVRPEAAWESLEEIAAGAVRRARGISSRPVFIAETACPPGPGRVRWIRDALDWARGAGLVGLVWFNANKECDWRLESDDQTAAAWARAVGRPIV
jgi:hypothetical protein